MTSSKTSPHSLAREILLAQAQALNSLAENLTSSIDTAAKILLNISSPSSAASSQGRIIISGMGKAGFIGMKVSATFASVGFPSFFLHPAEAIHGDLGRFTKHDVSLIFSKSGETPEILGMLPYIKRVGCPVISITASENSRLGKLSDVVIEIGNIEESKPLALAPTTSTTVMLALGDALAMTLAQETGLTREEYALFHPGGDLGRSLTTVGERMRTGEANCVLNAKTLVKDALHAIVLTKGRPGAAAIVGDEGKLIGMFTDGDLRRLLDQDPLASFIQKPLSSFVGKNLPKTITADKLIQEAMRIMSEFKIDQLLVVDEKFAPIGLLDVQDILG